MTPQREEKSNAGKQRKEIPISRADAPKKGVAFHSSSSHVLDLRSMIAQREIRARKKQTAAETVKKAKKKPKKKPAAPKQHETFSLLPGFLKSSSKPAAEPKEKKIPPTSKAETAASFFERSPIPLMPDLFLRRGKPIEKEIEEEQEALTPLPSTQTSALSWSAVRSRLMVFVLLALVCLIPATVVGMSRYASRMEQQSTESAQQAINHMQAGAFALQQMQFTDAESEFTQAQQAFEQIQQELRFLPAPLLFFAKYIPGKPQQAYAGAQLVRAGKEGSIMAAEIAQALSTVRLDELKLNDPDANTGLTDVLAVMRDTLKETRPHFVKATKSIERVPIDAVPEQYRAIIQQAQTTLPRVGVIYTEGLDTFDILLTLLGHEDEQRYFVLFQNNTELRPTGGFIGSIALIDVYKGVVTEMDVPGGGIYDIAGQFTGKVVSPPPMHLINPHWNIQDANWFPDFPTSAQKVEWFAERSGYPSVDGVIALTPEVIEDLLAIVGPIDMTAEYGVTITEENFYTEVQTRAEEKFDETKESKKIIGAMTPLLFQKTFEAARNPQTLVQLLSLLQEQLDQKHLLLTVDDEDAEATLRERNWNGQLRSTEKDYLSVVHANIGGGKTDTVIDNSIQHEAVVAEDGSIIDTVTLTRLHKGDPTNVLQNINNEDYVRFYVPQGSELISATGFKEPEPKLFLTPDPDAEIDDDLIAVTGKITEDPITGVSTNVEFNKTVFGGWMHTPVGKSSTITISYRLPFTLRTSAFFSRDVDRYSLLVQKQPGTDNTFFEHQVEIPSNAHIAQTFPSTYQGTAEQLLDTDFFAGMMIEFR